MKAQELREYCRSRLNCNGRIDIDKCEFVNKLCSKLNGYPSFWTLEQCEEIDKSGILNEIQKTEN